MNRPINPDETSAATAQAEWQALLRSHPDIVYLDAAIADACGTLRGKRIAAADADKLFEAGMQIPASLPLMDARGEMTNAGGHGFGDGDPDATAWPIADTLTRVWGAAQPRAQMLMRLCTSDGAPLSYDARNVLERVAARFDELGLTPVAALELEFYLLDPARDALGRPQPPKDPRSGERENAISVYGLDDLDRYQDFLAALSDAAKLQRVPVSAATKEYAPGQFEANLRHQADPLRAADHAVLLRQIVKAAALANNFQASFMAKPFAERAGSGMHVHVSLLDRQGHNIFDNGSAEGSEQLRFGAGGLAALMPESMAIFAPNPNAYRRFAPDMFAPVNRRLGINNRSAGLRVPVGPSGARRIEHRCAGADANPYLVLAAVLAGLHYGLTNACDPGAPAIGNVSRQPDAALPFSLEDALAKLRAAPNLPSYFGAGTLALYAENKAVELERVKKPITLAEYDWYL
jgi:glutamine synthetase